MSRLRLLAKKALIDEQLAALDEPEEELESEEEEDSSPVAANHYENRIVVKFFWQQLGSPMDPDEWKDRDGVISVIRRRMGKGAPSMETCRRTLLRLVDDEDDDMSSKQIFKGRPRLFSHEEDLYVGLLICEGHSQRSATFLINGERTAQGLPPVSKDVIMGAEKRVELIRRRRQSTKSGSSDLESAWCKGSLAFALQVQMRLRAGAELARRPVVGRTFKLLRKYVPTGPLAVACLPSDAWGISFR